MYGLGCQVPTDHRTKFASVAVLECWSVGEVSDVQMLDGQLLVDWQIIMIISPSGTGDKASQSIDIYQRRFCSVAYLKYFPSWTIVVQ